MSEKKIIVSAPGKICIAGEWAVLEKGNPLIVASVDKRIFARIEEAREEFVEISLNNFDLKGLRCFFDGKGKLRFIDSVGEWEKRCIRFVRYALEAVYRYLEPQKPFSLEIWREKVFVEGKKGEKSVGFGNSAASVVATIGGIFSFFGEDISEPLIQKKIYKLSAIAHYFAQGKVGSGFDVASSTFGGLLLYKRFDPEWLKEQIKEGKSIKEIVDGSWPDFQALSVEIPEDLHLLIGWTGRSSSTAKMVKKMYRWKEKNTQEYVKIIKEIRKVVEGVVRAFKEGNKGKIIKGLRKNEFYLRELGKKSGVNIETESLAKLSEIANQKGAAGKLSGAGGGDCGIAVTFDGQVIGEIRKEWEENGIQVIDVNLSPDGVRIEP